MTNQKRAAEVIEEAMGEVAMGYPSMLPEIAQALADEGLLMPDLQEPTYISGSMVAWKNGGDEVFLEDGEICIASAIRSPERWQSLALAVFAAANYIERNQE